MAPQYDVGMTVAEVKNAANWMDQQGALSQKTIDQLMADLRSIQASWWGGRGAEALSKIGQAESSIKRFYEEIKRMNEILLENISAFEAFDQGG
jgi:hypothetical protein